MPNNIDSRYANAFALTITLASLANDSTNLLAGQESNVIDNGTNVYPDIKLSGRITTGTSPVAGNTIEIWAYSVIDDSPNTVVYPGGLTGSNAAITFASMNKKRAALRPVFRFTVDVTNNLSYDFSEISLGGIFRGVPRHWGIVVINGSGAALHSTAGNHFIIAKPQGFQVV